MLPTDLIPAYSLKFLISGLLFFLEYVFCFKNVKDSHKLNCTLATIKVAPYDIIQPPDSCLPNDFNPKALKITVLTVSSNSVSNSAKTIASPQF